MIYKKIYAWSISFTALVSFLVWHLVSSIENIPGIDGNIQIAINFAIGAFFSYGFFIGMVSVLGWLIVKNKHIKKLFFASSYIEGVWIGLSISNDNKVVLAVQQIEQTSDEVSVYGQTFEYNGGNPIFRSIWSSTGASFDSDNHSLNLTYISNKMDNINAGFCCYQFVNRKQKIPDMFFAYIGNYTKDRKIVSMCKRYYDLEKMPDLKVMVNDAKRFYEDQKELFDYHEKS